MINKKTTQITSTGTVPRKDGKKLITKKNCKNKDFPWDPNPVFIEKNAWWFYDADWIKIHGPYDTVEELDAAFDRYAEKL